MERAWWGDNYKRVRAGLCCHSPWDQRSFLGQTSVFPLALAPGQGPGAGGWGQHSPSTTQVIKTSQRASSADSGLTVFPTLKTLSYYLVVTLWSFKVKNRTHIDDFNTLGTLSLLIGYFLDKVFGH